MAPDPDLGKPPPPPAPPPRKLGDLSDSEEEEENVDYDAELKQIFGNRKKGSMSDEQQRYHEKAQEQKKMIRLRTQAWIACGDTHVKLDEEEERLVDEACKAIFCSTTNPNTATFLGAKLHQLLTLLPPQNRYSYYSLPFHFSDDRAKGLSALAALLIEDDYETPVETLIREEARISQLNPDSKDFMHSDDRVSAFVLRARLEGGSYQPVLPTNDANGTFIRFQEVLAAGSRVDPFEKKRQDLVWDVKKDLKKWVHEQSGFDFAPWDKVHELPVTDLDY